MTTSNPLDQFRESAREALKHRDTPNYWGLTRAETPLESLEAAAGELVIAELEGWYNAYRQNTGISKYGDLQDLYSAALKEYIADRRAALNKEDQG